MLKIEQNPQFTTTVVVNTLHTKGSFKATFVARRESELQALEKAAVAAGRGAQGVLPDVTVAVSELELPGNPNPSVQEALDYPGIAPAMVTAYYRGLHMEQLGNSAPPSAGS